MESTRQMQLKTGAAGFDSCIFGFHEKNLVRQKSEDIGFLIKQQIDAHFPAS